MNSLFILKHFYNSFFKPLIYMFKINLKKILFILKNECDGSKFGFNN